MSKELITLTPTYGDPKRSAWGVFQLPKDLDMKVENGIEVGIQVTPEGLCIGDQIILWSEIDLQRSRLL